jgi:putative transposase
MPEKLLQHAKEILAQCSIRSKVGRPMLEETRLLQGIYYLLKTGIQWAAMPSCFGSRSAVHRFFTKLVRADFFKLLWTKELREYELHHGLDLTIQAMDCAHRKSPLGKDKSGNSPVDRRKMGTKLSVLSERNGIVLGLAVGGANQHDSKLFLETLRSVSPLIKQPYSKQMHLDAAYDSQEVRTILFNHYYVPKIAPNKRRKKERPPNPLGYCRWFIEPVHSWMNRFRAVAVRYSKYAKNYLAFAQFAVAVITYKKNLI